MPSRLNLFHLKLSLGRCQSRNQNRSLSFTFVEDCCAHHFVSKLNAVDIIILNFGKIIVGNRTKLCRILAVKPSKKKHTMYENQSLAG